MCGGETSIRNIFVANTSVAAEYSIPGSVVDLDRLDIVMKLRSENASLRSRVAHNERRVVESAEETLQASLTADKFKFKYEQVLEMGRLQGVKIDTEVRNFVVFRALSSAHPSDERKRQLNAALHGERDRRGHEA